MECGAHAQLTGRGGGTAAGGAISLESVHYTLSIMPLKCRGGDQFTCPFLVSERMDPDNHLFSFVIVYLSLQLAS